MIRLAGEGVRAQIDTVYTLVYSRTPDAKSMHLAPSFLRCHREIVAERASNAAEADPAETDGGRIESDWRGRTGRLPPHADDIQRVHLIEVNGP